MMEEFSDDIIPLEDLVQYLLWQQFWRPPNLILDRSKQLRVPCPGSEQVISSFQEILYNNFLYIVGSSNSQAYLRPISTTCFELELEPKSVIDDYKKRIPSADPNDPTWSIFLLQTALGSIITKLAENAYNIMISELKRNFHKTPPQLFSKAVKFFQETGNPVYSMTIHLQKILLMAQITNLSIDQSVLKNYYSRLITDFQGKLEELRQNSL